jgi:hypothetical protein
MEPAGVRRHRFAWMSGTRPCVGSHSGRSGRGRPTRPGTLRDRPGPERHVHGHHDLPQRRLHLNRALPCRGSGDRRVIRRLSGTIRHSLNEVGEYLDRQLSTGPCDFERPARLTSKSGQRPPSGTPAAHRTRGAQDKGISTEWPRPSVMIGSSMPVTAQPGDQPSSLIPRWAISRRTRPRIRRPIRQ